jgi:hypothetical protein
MQNNQADKQKLFDDFDFLAKERVQLNAETLSQQYNVFPPTPLPCSSTKSVQYHRFTNFEAGFIVRQRLDHAESAVSEPPRL